MAIFDTQYLAPGSAIFDSQALSEPDTPPVQAFHYIRYSLVTHEIEQHVNLINLQYALFAQLSPSSFTAPVVKGVIPSISGPAQLNLAVPAAVVPVGWYMLVLSDADNTTTVAVPVLVVA